MDIFLIHFEHKKSFWTFNALLLCICLAGFLSQIPAVTVFAFVLVGTLAVLAGASLMAQLSDYLIGDGQGKCNRAISRMFFGVSAAVGVAVVIDTAYIYLTSTNSRLLISPVIAQRFLFFGAIFCALGTAMLWNTAVLLKYFSTQFMPQVSEGLNGQIVCRQMRSCIRWIFLLVLGSGAGFLFYFVKMVHLNPAIYLNYSSVDSFPYCGLRALFYVYLVTLVVQGTCRYYLVSVSASPVIAPAKTRQSFQINEESQEMNGIGQIRNSQTNTNIVMWILVILSTIALGFFYGRCLLAILSLCGALDSNRFLFANPYAYTFVGVCLVICMQAVVYCCTKLTASDTKVMFFDIARWSSWTVVAVVLLLPICAIAFSPFSDFSYVYTRSRPLGSLGSCMQITKNLVVYHIIAPAALGSIYLQISTKQPCKIAMGLSALLTMIALGLGI